RIGCRGGDGSRRLLADPSRRICHLLASQFGCSLLDRRQDLRVLATAADVAGERIFDLLSSRILVVLEQREGGHNESTRADAALETAFEPEGALKRMQSLKSRPTCDTGHSQDLLSASKPCAQQGA